MLFLNDYITKARNLLCIKTPYDFYDDHRVFLFNSLALPPGYLINVFIKKPKILTKFAIQIAKSYI